MKVLLPEQVIALMERLPYPVKIAVLLVAPTGVRISECLAFRWSHVEWNESKIRIDETFRRGEIQKRTKTLTSKAPVPMCGALAAYLAEWRQQTLYNKDEDFIFASPTLNGKQPLWGQTMNADFGKPAVLALGLLTKRERFGWHRFRHSLSTWANEVTKDITVSQTLLRHSKPDMTLSTPTEPLTKHWRRSGNTWSNCWRQNPHRRPPNDLRSGWHRAVISAAKNNSHS